MELLLHQVTIFVLMTMHAPLIMIQIIFILEKKGWINYLCFGIVITVLLINLPTMVENYQQLEIITKTTTIVDIITLILILSMMAIFIIDNTMIKRRDKDIKLLKNRTEELKGKHSTWDKKSNWEKHTV